MKLVRFSLLAVLVVVPLLAHGQEPAASNNKAIQEVIDFRNKYIEAEENRDMAYLDKVLADDFFAVNPQGQMLDKARQLANLNRPERTLKVLNPRETQVHFYGNVAILTEHVTVVGTDKGRPFGGEYRFVRVFVKRNGNWQVAMAQGSPIPSPSATTN